MVIVNTGRFKEVFTKIFNAYASRTGIFASLDANNFGPQHLYWPRNVSLGDENHLYWLALVAMSDKRTNSTQLYNCFAKMFSRNPSLYVRGRYPTRARMSVLFRKYKIALPEKEIAFFIERKKHLDELFGGVPATIFAGVNDIDELMLKLKALGKAKGIKNIFPGAKKKIFTLLAMFLSEFIDMDFLDVVPVDVWVQSICNSTGVLGGSGQIDIIVLEQELRPLMTRLFREFRNVRGISNATWIHGRALCTNCTRVDTSKLCSVYSECAGPFSRMRHPVTGKSYGRVKVPADYLAKKSDPV